MLEYTIIKHGPKRKFGLTFCDYIVADAIFFLSHNPNNANKGWCFASKKTLADMLDIGVKQLYLSTAKLESLGLIEKHQGKKRLLRTTSKWYDHFVGNELRQKSVKSTDLDVTKSVKSTDLDNSKSVKSTDLLYKEENKDIISNNGPEGAGTEVVTSESQDIQKIIAAFYDSGINRNQNNFRNQTQRKAAAQLARTYGADKVVRAIWYYATEMLGKDPYVPGVTTPVQLLDKWTQVAQAAMRMKTNKPNKTVRI